MRAMRRRIAGAALAFPFAVLAVIRARFPAFMPDPGKLLSKPGKYTSTHYALLLGALATQVGLASLIALGWYKVRFRGDQGERITPHDVVWNVFRRSTPTPTLPVVDIRTSSGLRLRGKIASFDVTCPIADRFIALAPPLLIEREPHEGEQPPPQSDKWLPQGWERSVVPMSEVVEMHVGYADPNEPGAT